MHLLLLHRKKCVPKYIAYRIGLDAINSRSFSNLCGGLRASLLHYHVVVRQQTGKLELLTSVFSVLYNSHTSTKVVINVIL